MSQIKSIKDLLISHDFVGTTANDGKRHASHEFQAYAYRLAHDLNDLGNLKIYMKLAKNVERTLLEQAYSFSIDSRFENKGPIFLWKLKLIRAEVKKLRAKNSYDYTYIQSNLKDFKNKFAKQILDKGNEDFDKSELVFHEIKSLIEPKSVGKKSVKQSFLFIGIENSKVVKYFSGKDVKAQAIDISKEVVKLIKEKKSLKVKAIGKDFFKNNYKEESFDVIFIESVWNCIPSDAETEFIKEILRIKKPDSTIVLGVKVAKELTQKWEVVKSKKDVFDVFVKYSNVKEVVEKWERFGFKLLAKEESFGKAWLVIE